MGKEEKRRRVGGREKEEVEGRNGKEEGQRKKERGRREKKRKGERRKVEKWIEGRGAGGSEKGEWRENEKGGGGGK